jgi:hypothetical protein
MEEAAYAESDCHPCTKLPAIWRKAPTIQNMSKPQGVRRHQATGFYGGIFWGRQRSGRCICISGGGRHLSCGVMPSQTGFLAAADSAREFEIKNRPAENTCAWQL